MQNDNTYCSSRPWQQWQPKNFGRRKPFINKKLTGLVFNNHNIFDLLSVALPQKSTVLEYSKLLELNGQVNNKGQNFFAIENTF